VSYWHSEGLSKTNPHQKQSKDKEMTQDQLRSKLRQVLESRKVAQRPASAQIGIGYATLLNFLQGANVSEWTLERVKAWIGKDQ
jgi:hypothetical protein